MNEVRKSFFSMIIAGTMLMMTLAGCGESKASEDGNAKLVAITLPTDASAKWVDSGTGMSERLEDLGYNVDLQYAQGNASAQIDQVEDMIAEGAKCIVIGAINPGVLVEIEEEAAKAGIPVISYDVLLTDTDAVSYYVSFDNKAVGKVIGDYIVSNADFSESNPKTIEFFMGAPEDDGARKIYEGLMEVLRPYLKNGSLECKSEQTDFDEVSTEMWSQKLAMKRCEDILNTYYKKDKLDICVTAYDGMAYGCINAFENAGYTSVDWPIIVGQDAERKAINYIVTGKETMTVYKNSKLLAEQCVNMVKSIMEGTDVEVNDTQSIDNGVKKVPSYLFTPIYVDESNYKDIIN